MIIKRGCRTHGVQEVKCVNLRSSCEREYSKQSFSSLCPVNIVLYQCLKKENLLFNFCRRLGLWKLKISSDFR